MATRSTINIRNNDGSISSIYCHWDGYVEGVGEILVEHYNTEQKVRELLELGDLSSLGKEIGKPHDFNNPTEHFCVSYSRDRGETNCEAVTYSDWGMLSKQSYNYLYENGEWYVEDFNGSRLTKVVDELHKLESNMD